MTQRPIGGIYRCMLRSPNGIGQAAEIGTLSPQAAWDLAKLKQFFAQREKAMLCLMGTRLRPSQLRDEILRDCLLSFAAGRVLTVAEFLKRNQVLASPNTIRAEIDVLQSVGVVALIKRGPKRAGVEIWPTGKAVAFYNHEMPSLRETIVEILRDEGVHVTTD